MSKKDSRQLQQETFATIASDITTIIYALLTIPVFSSLILTMCKLFIHTVLPKTLVDFEKSNVKLIDKLLNVTDWLVKFLSKSATIYIKGIQMILSAIPKYKRLNDTERKKIAVGIYYTVTIGFAIKVIKTIMIKTIIPIPYGKNPATASMTLFTAAYHPVSVAYCNAKKNNAPNPIEKKK